MKISPWLCLAAYLFTFAFTLGRADSSPRSGSKFNSRPTVPTPIHQAQNQAPPTAPAQPQLPAEQKEHDWLVRDRWGETFINPAARGDPFDLAWMSAPSPVFTSRTPVKPTTITPPALSVTPDAAQLSTNKKVFRIQLSSARPSHRVSSQKKEDDSPSVTILAPLSTDESEATSSKPTSDDPPVASPPPAAIDDNTNDVDMPGLMAAQRRKTQEKAKIDASAVQAMPISADSPTLNP